MGGSHSQVEGYIASPTFSLCWYTIHGSVQRTTSVDIFCVHHCSTNNKLRILVRAQLSTQSTWPLSPTRVAIWLRDLGLPSEYTLGHCCLFAASRHKLAFTSRHYSLLTATKLHFFVKEKCLFSMFWPPHQGFQGHILNNLVINTSLNANTDRKLGKSPRGQWRLLKLTD